jgi:hypothetical protein
VQPAADPIAGLDHDAVNAAMRQGAGDRQSGDARSDDHHTLDRPRHSGGNDGLPVVETLSSQPGPPSAKRYMLWLTHPRRPFGINL